MVITTGEASKAHLSIGRKLFITYFTDLYKDLSPENIGINCSLEVYLNTIFDKTNLTFNDGSLYASFAYSSNNIV